MHAHNTHLQEILLAIKLVKFYVWESCLGEQVSEVSWSGFV